MRIAITGTPGTGKSEIAEKLGKEMGMKVFHLSKFAEKFSAGYDEKRKCIIVDVERLAEYLKDEHGIFESHFSHLLPVDAIIVLRANPETLRERLKRRGWEEKKIEENVEAEIMEICLSESLETSKPVLQIDTTNAEVKEVVKKIKEWIKTLKLK